MTVVLDASAVLALLFDEPGKDRVLAAFSDGPVMSSVNLGEVAAFYVRHGMAESHIRTLPERLPVVIVSADIDLCIEAALLVPLTRPAGLSLGDRTCLALAKRLGVRAVTADRAWASIARAVGVQVELIR